MQDTTEVSSSMFLESVLRDDGLVLDHVRDSHALPKLISRALIWSAVGSIVFGASLGIFAGNPLQILASAAKLPILLLGAALLCFPTFHVIQVLRASKPVSLSQAAAVQSRALAATAVTWAAFALPLFFLVGTTSHYRFAQFLALGVGVAGGVVGFRRLVVGYRRICVPAEKNRFIYLYLLVFGAVGAQLALVLRPFVGSPYLEFQSFRNLEGNIFEHVVGMLGL